MRKIRQVLRLALDAGVSRRSISRSLGLSRDVVTDYLTRAAAAGLTWPLPPDLDDAQLEDRLFPPLAVNLHRKPEPDWSVIHQEMKRKGATLQVLHEEFLADQPNVSGNRAAFLPTSSAGGDRIEADWPRSVASTALG